MKLIIYEMASIYVIFLKILYNLLFFLYFLLPENIYTINQNSKTSDEFTVAINLVYCELL
jgi:hypothetical protein